MRPSKLRLPLSTETTARSSALTTSETSFGQRARVADARGAAVADEVEAELLEVRRPGRPSRSTPITTFEPGASDVFTHGLHCRPALDGVLGQQPGGDHHVRVRCVRARRDRGDDHVAVVELGLRAVLEREVDVVLLALGHLQAAGAALRGLEPHGRCRCRCATAGRRPGTSPRLVDALSRPWPGTPGSSDSASGSGLGQDLLERDPERRLGLRQRHAVLRALRDRPARARRRRGRAPASRCTSAPRSPRRATGPARARTPRRSRSAPRSGP